MPNDYETTYDARQGYSLVLTIDEVIQYFLEQQLAQAVTETQAKYAYGIVMDVKTGAILGMSTMPDYDLNSPYKIHSDAVIKEIEENIKNDKKSTCVNESASIPHDSFFSIVNLSNNANFNNSLFKSKSVKIPILDKVLTLAVVNGLKGMSRLIDGM